MTAPLAACPVMAPIAAPPASVYLTGFASLDSLSNRKRQQSLFVSGKPGLPKGVWVFHRAKQVLWDAKKACGHVWMSATLNCAAPIIQGPTVYRKYLGT